MTGSPRDPGAARADGERRVGFFTTDAALVVRSWDAALERLTGISASEARGRPLDEIAGDLRDRRLLDLVREPLRTGTTQVLAPALHHYLFRCPPAEPSAEFDAMQQRVVIAPLQNESGVAGLAVSIEDVTARLEAERQLARELRGADPSTRRAALERLAAHEPVTGLGPIREALAHDDWQFRRIAVRSAGRGRDNGELVQALVDTLREGHRDFSLLSSAITLLTMSGVDAAAALGALLESDDADLRIQAALALGTQRTPEATTALIGALDDPDVNVRFHAIESLGKLGAAAASERLAAILDSRDFFLAFPALDALVRLGDATLAPRIVPLLEDPTLAAPAADALGQLGDESAVAPLASVLDRQDAPVASVVAALAAIHAHYEETSGAGGRIEDLVRRHVSAAGAERILAEVPRAAGAGLRATITVLSWLRGAAIERQLAATLGRSAVQHEVVETLVRFGSPMVDLLVAQLDRDDAATRRAAAIALGRIGDRRAVPALIGIVERGERDLLVPAAGALARIGDARAFEPLLALLGDDDIAVRRAAVGALNSIGHPDMALRAAALLESDDRHVRESAARVAGYFGYAETADRMIAIARADADEGVRATALEHLPYVEDPRIVGVLVDAVAGDSPRARAAAAHALAQVDGAAAAAALTHALRDGDPWVRYFSALSLGRRGEHAAFDDLAAVALADPARQVKIAAVEAIGALGNGRAITFLAPLVSLPDGDLATTAIRAIGGIDAPAAVPALREALRSPDPRRRIAAAEAFGTVASADAVEVLRWTASADADPLVVRAALDALGAVAAKRHDAAALAVDALVTVGTDPGRQTDALAVLVRIPPASIAPLGAALEREDPAARAVAVEALGRIARPPASTHLVRALDDVDPAVRRRAIVLLSRLGTRGVSRRLAALARTDESPAVRRAAELALTRAGADDVEDGS